MPYLHEFFTVVIIHLLAVMSPGPDFALVSRNSMVYSRKTAILSAAGLALGILVHVTYSLVGIGYLVARSIVLFSIIKFLGAGYLIYIGYRSLRAHKTLSGIADAVAPSPGMKPRAAVRMGFFTNILNPKVTLFFLALFTQVIRADTPFAMKLLYGAEVSIMTFCWFSCVAMVLSHRAVKTRFAALQHILEKVFGAILIAFGIKIAFAHARK